MYKGIEHTAIATPDPEALASWYDKTLNFPIAHRYVGNVFVTRMSYQVVTRTPQRPSVTMNCHRDILSFVTS